MSQPTFVTNRNKTPLIQVVTWFLLATTILSVIARAFTKAAVIRFAGLDDCLVPVALFFAVGQAIAVTIQTTNGVGKPTSELSPYQTDAIMKAGYAASLLYIMSLLFSKLPVLVLLGLISPSRRYKHMLVFSAIVLVLWALTAEFVSAFQCRSPAVWDYLAQECLDLAAWWTYFEIMNGVTDLCLVLLPLSLMWGVQTSLKKKVSVLLFFGGRVLVIGATICKLIFLDKTWEGSDPVFDTWPVTICTQTIQSLSIISACILYLRPFLEALTSGFINGDDLRRQGAISPYTLISSNTASGFALKDRKESSDLDGISVSQSPPVEMVPIGERVQHLLPEIPPVPSMQDIGKMEFAVERRI